MSPLTVYSDYGLLILQVVLGIIFVYHGLPKLKNPKAVAVGMFGSETLAWFPLLIGILELLSGIGLVIGLFVEYAALVIAFIMAGATSMKILKWKAPFSAMDKTGWEFDLILLASALAILLTGGGASWIIG